MARPLKAYLGLLVALDCFKCRMCLRAGLLDCLGLLDQHVTLACFDVNLGLFLVDLRFPWLELFLFLLDLIMKYLGLICERLMSARLFEDKKN